MDKAQGLQALNASEVKYLKGLCGYWVAMPQPKRIELGYFPTLFYQHVGTKTGIIPLKRGLFGKQGDFAINQKLLWHAADAVEKEKDCKITVRLWELNYEKMHERCAALLRKELKDVPPNRGTNGNGPFFWLDENFQPVLPRVRGDFTFIV